MINKGQVWIETVLYTIIGLALIALVLTYITPKINEMKDRAIVDQTISAMNTLSGKIIDLKASPGSVKIIQFTLNRGELYINSSADEIIFKIGDIGSPYSEQGVEVPIGDSKVITTTSKGKNDIKVKIKFDDINITYSGNDELKKFNSATTPYKFSLTNKGVKNSQYNVDITTI